MSLYSNFKTDTNLEVAGVDLNYGKNSKGKDMLIKVRRAGGANKAYQKAITNKMRPFQRQIQTGTMDNGVADQLILDVYAETVVIGWENIEDENGNELPFSVENVKKVFSDLPDLAADVRSQAQEIAIFRADVVEAIAKN